MIAKGVQNSGTGATESIKENKGMPASERRDEKTGRIEKVVELAEKAEEKQDFNKAGELHDKAGRRYSAIGLRTDAEDAFMKSGDQYIKSGWLLGGAIELGKEFLECATAIVEELVKEGNIYFALKVAKDFRLKSNRVKSAVMAGVTQLVYERKMAPVLSTTLVFGITKSELAPLRSEIIEGIAQLVYVGDMETATRAAEFFGLKRKEVEPFVSEVQEKVTHLVEQRSLYADERAAKAFKLTKKEISLIINNSRQYFQYLRT